MMINRPYLGLAVCWCCAALCGVPTAWGQASAVDGAVLGQVSETTDHAHRVQSEGATRGVVPRPYTGDEPFLMALWRPDADSVGQGTEPGDPVSCSPRFDSPWGSRLPMPGQLPEARTVTVPRFERPEFTAELWVRLPDEPPSGDKRQGLLEYFVGEERAWSLFLEDDEQHLRLTFHWQDEDGTAASTSAPLAANLPDDAGRWVHVAVAFRNLRSLFSSDDDMVNHRAHRYNAVLLYVTPAGSPLAQLAGGRQRNVGLPRMRMEAGRLVVGGSDDPSRFGGWIAEAALFGITKSENQFGTLGGHPPEDLVISDDVPCGGGRDPVVDQAGQIVLSSGRDYQSSDSFWFHFRVDGQPGLRQFRLLPSKGNTPMAAAAYVSYDRQRWERIADAQRVRPRVSPSVDAAAGFFGELHVTVDLKQTPAWLATGIPYLEEHVAELEAELADWPAFRTRKIGRSHGGRPIHGWTITDPESAPRGKQTIVMTHGQHAQTENMSGQFFTSMLRSLRGRNDADELLRRIALLIVPLVNVDNAAEGGNTVLNHNCINLNRDWQDLSQPETACVVEFLEDWARQGGVMVAGIDWHAGGTGTPHLRGARTAELDALAPGLGARQERFGDLLMEHMGFRHLRQDPLRGGRFRQRFASGYRVPGFTVEMMTLRHFNPHTEEFEPLTQQRLEELGPALLEACLKFLANP